MSERAYDKVWWRGVRLTARHRNALRWAEAKLQKKFPGVSIIPTQGSWSSGSLSAGTHGGAGAVDLRTWHLMTEQRVYLVRCLKDSGQAAWYRTEAQGFDPHVHSLDIGGQIGMDTLAKVQIKAFDAKRDGLSGNKADNTYRPTPRVKFSFVKNAPVPR